MIAVCCVLTDTGRERLVSLRFVLVVAAFRRQKKMVPEESIWDIRVIKSLCYAGVE